MGILIPVVCAYMFLYTSYQFIWLPSAFLATSMAYLQADGMMPPTQIPPQTPQAR
jgi:high-affinity Fe2+/Pb2+ permease